MSNDVLWQRWARDAAAQEWERLREFEDAKDSWIPLGVIPCESPIERRLMAHLRAHAEQYGFKVETQFKLGPYRYDFVVKRDGKAVALIECDGATFHSTPEQRERDLAKDELAQKHGLVMFRFTGRQINHNAWKCAEEIIFRLWGR